MTRTTRRISRALLIGLGGTLALGTVFWLGNLTARRANHSDALRSQRIAAATQPVDRIAAQLSQSSVTIAPPATRPSGSLAAAAESSVLLLAPTTKPAGKLPEPQVASETQTPLSDAKEKVASAKLLDARRILNTSLVAGSLSDADAKAAKKMLGEINATVVFSSKRFPSDEFGGTLTVPSGGVLAKIANSHEVTAELLMRINGITDARKLRAGQAIKVLKGPFHAVVDKSDFALELWLGEPNARGSMFITTLPVGLGADDSTPTGVWAVQNKLKNPTYYSPRGEGIINADDPKNPLGEYWIGLTGTDGHAVGKQSYGIHGTIEPETIGKQASMGCIRLKNEDAALVYEMMVEGKGTVTVRE